METACVDGHSRLSVVIDPGHIRTHLYLYDKGKGVCVRDVCAIYDNNISPSLLMIIIKIIILYFIQIRHTDAFPPTGTLLVFIILEIVYVQRHRALCEYGAIKMLCFIIIMSSQGIGFRFVSQPGKRVTFSIRPSQCLKSMT